jgi:hypothetical protein
MITTNLQKIYTSNLSIQFNENPDKMQISIEKKILQKICAVFFRNFQIDSKVDKIKIGLRNITVNII